MERLERTSLHGMASLSEESHLAGKVKKEQPILVIKAAAHLIQATQPILGTGFQRK